MGSKCSNSSKNTFQAERMPSSEHRHYTNAPWLPSIVKKLLKAKVRHGSLADIKALAYEVGNEQAFYNKFFLSLVDKDLAILQEIFEVERLLQAGSQAAMHREHAVALRISSWAPLELFVAYSDIRLENGFVANTLADIARAWHGPLHLSMIVGDLVLEWGCGQAGDSIVYPTSNEVEGHKEKSLLLSRIQANCYGKPVMVLSSTTESLDRLRQNKRFVEKARIAKENTLRRITKVATLWNRDKTYYPAFGKNCQDFFDSVINELGLRLNPDDNLKSYCISLIASPREKRLYLPEASRTFLNEEDLEYFVLTGQHLRLSKSSKFLLYNMHLTFVQRRISDAGLNFLVESSIDWEELAYEGEIAIELI
jgi:hypothetical protein